jgi:hypothetical protein
VLLCLLLLSSCLLVLKALSWIKGRSLSLRFCARQVKLLHNSLFVIIIKCLVLIQVSNKLLHLLRKLFRVHPLALVILSLVVLEFHSVSLFLTLDV